MLILVDAHVHVHPMCDVAGLLDAASGHFSAQASILRTDLWEGVLLLSEMQESEWFESVRTAGLVAVGHWHIRPHVSDPLALVASVGARRILMVAGRQVVSSEGVEILTLATRTRLPDGEPLSSTIAAARATGSLVVLPWAVGKWIGHRGELVSDAVANHPDRPFAGDNAGRPRGWPRPAVLAREASRNRPVLSGSDPLPLAGDETRAGSYGFAIAGPLDAVLPARCLRDVLLTATAADVVPFGRLQGPLKFVRNQVGLRLAPGKGSVRPPSAPQAVGCRETPDIETSSAGYARRFAGSAGRYLLDVQSAMIRRAISDLPPGRALDLGGGHGQLVILLRELGWDVTVHGTDDQCERNLHELHGHSSVPFLKGDLFALPVADRSFDLVIAVRLVSHIDAWARLLAEMCRVSGRSVVIDYPCTGGLNALTPLLFGLKKSLEGNTRTYTSFPRAALEAEFERSGFRRVRELKQFFLPMVVHRVGKAVWPLRMAEKLFRGIGLTALLGSPAILRVDRR